MMIKRLQTILVTGLLMLGLQAQAQEFACLTVTADGTQTDYQLSMIQKITFDSSDMIIWSAERELARLPKATLGSMFFSNGSTGISTRNAQPSFSIKDGMLHVASGSQVDIFTIDGKTVKRFATKEATSIKLNTLNKGTFIIKVNNQAKKISTK